jgi:hypothetical protein
VIADVVDLQWSLARDKEQVDSIVVQERNEFGRSLIHESVHPSNEHTGLIEGDPELAPTVMNAQCQRFRISGKRNRASQL